MIDEKDAGILRLLQQNDRTTIKELADQICLSPSPTFDRQKKLEREKVIEKYAAIVDYRKAGNRLIVLCYIQLKEQSSEFGAHFVGEILQMEEVVECYNTSGDYDYMAKIYLRNMEHYEEFINNKLGKIKSIKHFHSTFVISEVKNTHFIPVYPNA